MRTAKDIAQQLASQADRVAEYLLPQGKKYGSEWHVGNIYGEQGDSLRVSISGSKAGIWADFASGGKGGDLLDLWAQSRNISLMEAIKECSRYLGLDYKESQISKPQNTFKCPQRNFGEPTPESAVIGYLTGERKLDLETVKAYRISEHVNHLGPRIVFPYIRDDETIFIKYLALARVNGKKQIAAEKDCEPCLFGWHLISPDARKITLCEGEIDAMTLHQYGIPALSVPFGGGTGNKHKWLEYEFERLSIFDEIYLCFDDDTEGKAAAKDLSTRLGNYRCKLVTLPYKDANSCLQASMSALDVLACFDKAVNVDPTEFKRAQGYAQDVIALFYPPDGIEPGYTLPWEKTKDKILLRPGDLTVWTGINGHGKSQIIGHSILHWISLGARVCIASLELKPARLLMRLAKQAGALARPSRDYIQAIHNWYADNLWLFDLVGTAKADRLFEVFLYARQRYGVDVFIIDSLMKLDISEDDYKGQKALMEKLCDFKNEHNCHVHIVIHPRKSMDESKAPGKLDNKGTGAISDLADNCLSVWRNKKKEEIAKLREDGFPLDAKQVEVLLYSDGSLICDKQRNGDWEGKIGLWFDRGSLQYLNYEGEPPTRYVDFKRALE